MSLTFESQWRNMRIARRSLSLLLLYSLGSVILLFGFGWAQGPFLQLATLAICAAAFMVQLATAPIGGLTQSKIGLQLILWIALLPLLSIAAQFFFHPDLLDNHGRSAFGYTWKLYVVAILWLLAGAGLANSWVKKSQVMALLLILPVFLVALRAAGGDIQIAYQLADDMESGRGPSHLTIENQLVMLIAFSYALSRRWLRLFVTIGGLIVLFLAEARAAFFLLPLSLLVCRFGMRQNLAGLGAVLVGICALGLGYLALGDLLNHNPVARKMLFLDGLDYDGSAITRSLQFSAGLEDLRLQWAVGYPSMLITRLGGLGNYMHNLLSAWQFFGVPFFLVTTVAIFVSLRRALDRAMHRDNDAMLEVFSVLIVYVAASVVVAKSVRFDLLWLALGYWLAYPSTRVRYAGVPPLQTEASHEFGWQ